MSSKTIAVIGLGSIGMRHCQNLLRMGHAVLAWDPDHSKVISAACGNWPLDHIYRKSEAIVIASPSAEHAGQLERAVKEGKHVFVEKPLSLSAPVASLRKTLKEAEKKKLVVFTGFNLRFNAAVQQAKIWLDKNLIGDIIWSSFWVSQKNTNSSYLRDGVIFNWASHEIDMALYLLGPATVLSCAAHWTEGNDDIATLVIRHDGDKHSVIHADYHTEPEFRQTLIVGTEGRIQITPPAHSSGINSKTCNVRFNSTESIDADYVNEMKAFLDRIDGKDVPGATGDDGLAAYIIASEARKMGEKK